MNTIQCDIVSARKSVFSGSVTMVIASGTAGELGITPRHAPLITTLRPGPVRLLTPDGAETTFIAGGGIMEVMPEQVTVLVDTVVRASDLDEAAAIQARNEAERELRNHKSKMEMAEAQAQLADAIEQLEALARWRKRVKTNR